MDPLGDYSPLYCARCECELPEPPLPWRFVVVLLFAGAVVAYLMVNP